MPVSHHVKLYRFFCVKCLSVIQIANILVCCHKKIITTSNNLKYIMLYLKPGYLLWIRFQEWLNLRVTTDRVEITCSCLTELSNSSRGGGVSTQLKFYFRIRLIRVIQLNNVTNRNMCHNVAFSLKALYMYYSYLICLASNQSIILSKLFSQAVLCVCQHGQYASILSNQNGGSFDFINNVQGPNTVN